MEPRVLVVIPAYNEEKTIASVLNGLRQSVPDFDRVVVSDGCKDSTSDIVAQMGERQLRLPTNLGYARAVQTGLRYGLARGYDIVVCCDADGQHRPDDVPRLVEALVEGDADLVIGSRFCAGRPYTGPLSRCVGQYLFSHLTGLLTRHRVYDTTSGFKALRARACEVLVRGTFADFHTESIVKLAWFGYKITEVPITVHERAFGHSMHSIASFIEYPTRTLLLTLVASVDALLARRAR